MLNEFSATNKSLKPWPLGWKAKIGVIIPAVDNGYCSYEFRIICPEGVVTLETRAMMGQITIENLQRMRQDVIYAAKLLAAAKPDAITYEATAAGFVLGPEGDKELIKEIQDVTGIPATTGSNSVTESFRFLGIKKMLIYAATPEVVTLKSIEYFHKLGFQVAAHESLGANFGHDVSRVSPWEIYRSAMTLLRQCPDVEGIFLSGGAFRTLEMLETLEKDSGLPVVTTVPANMWHCLKLIGVNDPIHGYGQLLEKSRVVTLRKPAR
jgi:maleate isomerase